MGHRHADHHVLHLRAVHVRDGQDLPHVGGHRGAGGVVRRHGEVHGDDARDRDPQRRLHRARAGERVSGLVGAHRASLLYLRGIAGHPPPDHRRPPDLHAEARQSRLGARLIIIIIIIISLIINVVYLYVLLLP